MKNATATVETIAARTERVLATEFSQLAAKDVNFLIEKITKAAPFVLKGINKDMATDFVQDALLKYWEKPSAYNSAKSNFYTFILNSARNLAIDFHRSAADKTSQKASVKLSETDKDGENISHSIEKYLNDETADFSRHVDATEEMLAVIEKLTPRQLEILKLESEGYKGKEIAELLEVGPVTVRQEIWKARQVLGVVTGYGTKGAKAAAKKENATEYMTSKEIAAIELELA